MMETKFKKDGYDYVMTTDKAEYCVSKHYDAWAVWIDDVKQDNLFDYLADAKQWCLNHYKELCEG